MTFGFQQVVRLPTNFRVTGIPCDVWEFPDPVGQVLVTGLCNPGVLEAAPEVRVSEVRKSEELGFYGSGYSAEGEARAAGEQLAAWLRVTSALHDLGFDLGDGAMLTKLSPHRKADEEKHLGANNFLVDDVHGLITFEDRGRTRRLMLRLHANDLTVLVLLTTDQVRLVLVRGPLLVVNWINSGGSPHHAVARSIWETSRYPMKASICFDPLRGFGSEGTADDSVDRPGQRCQPNLQQFRACHWVKSRQSVNP